MGLSAGGIATLLFTDIEGSARLWEADGEAMAEASARYNRLVREQVEAAGGHVFAAAGEAFRAVLPGPGAALAAAMAIQRAGTGPWPSGLPVRVRVALHAGACVERDGDYLGPAVNRAAQLLAVGHGGQVVVTRAMRELLADRLPDGTGLRDLGEHRLKDLGRPEQVFQVTGPGLTDGFGPLRSLDEPSVRNNLPSQATSFIGRGTELAELRSLLGGRARLVTIAGPGGIGKSRLALQAAAEALDGRGHGAWLTELAPVAEPELVARAVAAVLGVREEPGRFMLDTLVEAVGDRHLLLILDNAEHVLGAVAKTADAILQSCPRCCLLVTSRQPLGIGGEHVMRVGPLAVPPADLAAPGAVAAFESVQLFTEHAALRRPGFEVDAANAAAVTAVCRRLDGIPLAIELAAARLGSLSAAEISSRLDRRFQLLIMGSRTAMPRHQTLRALIDWSFELLSLDERTVAERLSVFAGSWTLEAAEAVTAGGGIEEWQVLDLLAALVDKSLVQAEENRGTTRYRLLETLRAYAAEGLARQGSAEAHAARAAHRDHYLALVEVAAPRLRGPDERRWLDAVEADFDNVRAALAFSVADPGSPEAGLRLATGLRWFCYMRGHSVEVTDALSALLERPGGRQPTRYLARALAANCHLLNHFGRNPPIPAMAAEAITIARDLGDDSIAGDALAALCWFNYLHNDLPAALARADEAVALARASGDARLLTAVLGHRAVYQSEAGDLAASLADQQEVLALARAAGDNYVLALTLVNLGLDQLIAGDAEAALAHLRDALTLADVHGYQHLAAGVQANLAFACLTSGDIASARRLLISVVDTARATGEKTYVHAAVLGLALAAGADGDPAVAATLHGAADHEYALAGQNFEVIEAGLRDADHGRLRGTLGQVGFDAAYQHGWALSQSEAVSLAVSAAGAGPPPVPALTVPAPRRAPAGSAVGLLSAREREILTLLAAGASDAQIAERLFVSRHTVRSHLERIRDKTGARRRVDLARYATEAGLGPGGPGYGSPPPG